MDWGCSGVTLAGAPLAPPGGVLQSAKTGKGNSGQSPGPRKGRPLPPS